MNNSCRIDVANNFYEILQSTRQLPFIIGHHRKIVHFGAFQARTLIVAIFRPANQLHTPAVSYNYPTRLSVLLAHVSCVHRAFMLHVLRSRAINAAARLQWSPFPRGATTFFPRRRRRPERDASKKPGAGNAA